MVLVGKNFRFFLVLTTGALQVNAGLQTNGAAGDREELEDGTGEGTVATEGFFTGLKAGYVQRVGTGY
ncbi:unnamed protein product [Staurois parvus]|uniref:Secreted protein n=1 Tax=Staurois parvus TaxID=386267 RepID=A0ABN9H9C6_9NEOB|nr:unnamed protein product [Staurois parvus]